MNTVQFFVQGIPVGKGSMKAFVPPGRKYPVVVHDSSRSKPWATLISQTATDLAAATILGPVALTLAFKMPRPDYHYGTGSNSQCLKANAPHWHTKKPDLDKLTRLVCDSLTGILWQDDNQVTSISASKEYADDHKTGVTITIGAL